MIIKKIEPNTKLKYSDSFLVLIESCFLLSICPFYKQKGIECTLKNIVYLSLLKSNYKCICVY